MEQYLKANGIPYARGGPASKRKVKGAKKVLKQTRLPPTAAASPGSLRPRKIIKTLDKSPSKPPYFKPVSDEDSDSFDDAEREAEKQASRHTKHFFKPVSDSESDVQVPASQNNLDHVSTDLPNLPLPQSPIAPNGKSTKKSRQSKINFPPGGDRFLSSDPVDSEDEEFRSTQLAPRSDPPLVPSQPSLPSHTIDLDSDSDAVVQVEHSSSAPNRKRQIDISSDSGSEEELVTPLRRRQRFMPPQRSSPRGSPPPSSNRRSSQLTEARVEARDLDHNLIKTNKYRSANTKKDNFRNNLERLRRKKAGLPSSSEEDEDEDEQGGYSDEEAEAEDAWIVEDDVDRATILDDLPDIFQQPRQPIEQFKIAVQWDLLDLLMPQGGFEPDAYFKPAISWLRDRTVDGAQAAISSIWRRPYVRALRRGPELSAVETGNLGFYCDACGRTNRVATYVVKFMGARYDHATLEDLESDAESSDDDLEVDGDALADEEAERARKERIMRAEWNLGVNCYERTCVAHELFHLRKHLREEIHEKLSSMGLFSAAKKLARSLMTKSERIEFANQVTEELDRARFQQRLWTQYRSTIEKNEDYIVDPNAGRKRNKYVFS